MKKKEIIHRLRTLQGHLQAVEKMVEEERDCRSVLLQMQAVHGALQRSREQIFEHYLEECIRQAETLSSEDILQQVRSLLK